MSFSSISASSFENTSYIIQKSYQLHNTHANDEKNLTLQYNKG